MALLNWVKTLHCNVSTPKLFLVETLQCFSTPKLFLVKTLQCFSTPKLFLAIVIQRKLVGVRTQAHRIDFFIEFVSNPILNEVFRENATFC